MLPTFCPPTIWTISLEFYRKTSFLAADDFLGACCRKAMTPKKLWTLLFPKLVKSHESFEPLWGQPSESLFRHFFVTLIVFGYLGLRGGHPLHKPLLTESYQAISEEGEEGGKMREKGWEERVGGKGPKAHSKTLILVPPMI